MIEHYLRLLGVVKFKDGTFEHILECFCKNPNCEHTRSNSKDIDDIRLIDDKQYIRKIKVTK